MARLPGQNCRVARNQKLCLQCIFTTIEARGCPPGRREDTSRPKPRLAARHRELGRGSARAAQAVAASRPARAQGAVQKAALGRGLIAAADALTAALATTAERARAVTSDGQSSDRASDQVPTPLGPYKQQGQGRKKKQKKQLGNFAGKIKRITSSVFSLVVHAQKAQPICLCGEEARCVPVAPPHRRRPPRGGGAGRGRGCSVRRHPSARAPPPPSAGRRAWQLISGWLVDRLDGRLRFVCLFGLLFGCSVACWLIGSFNMRRVKGVDTGILRRQTVQLTPTV